MFSFELQAQDGAARAGLLSTPHGEVQTPCFMAVGTQGALKGVSVQQAESCELNILLANTYHLALRPGVETVHELGGIHQFSGWQRPMLTDSGGYQVFSLANNRKIDEEGVHFSSHLDGAKLLLSPEESIRSQRFIGADIIMAFDECPDANADDNYMRASIERTLRWLQRSIDAWQDDSKKWPRGADNQALYGITQGGLNHDLRMFSLEQTIKHDLPGFSIGGLSVGETAEEREKVLDWVCPGLPIDKPRYLMGVGTPIDLVEAVARGVDQFDCVLPTRMGRHGVAYTDQGPLHLMRQEYARDDRPIDSSVHSEASRVSRGYLRHLLKAKEMLGGILVSVHNIAYYQQLMRRMHQAITDKKFKTFANEFRKHYIRDEK
ncbi:MAG: tRNA guanosine(34) transglycosylase Tgt [Planctomycetes bacterium]|nr:tRNA guanosine(34) transglycosylase Tgt [Planctomycetota bacterium]